MKVRKNEIISPKNVFVPRWKIQNPSEEISNFLGGGVWVFERVVLCRDARRASVVSKVTAPWILTGTDALPLDTFVHPYISLPVSL